MQGGQAATLAKQTSWNQSMDEKQDTAVRYLKKQNSVDNRNLKQSDCKFRHGTGRTAVTGEQRSVFAERFRQVFPKKASPYFLSIERFARSVAYDDPLCTC